MGAGGFFSPPLPHRQVVEKVVAIVERLQVVQERLVGLRGARPRADSGFEPCRTDSTNVAVPLECCFCGK